MSKQNKEQEIKNMLESGLAEQMKMQIAETQDEREEVTTTVEEVQEQPVAQPTVERNNAPFISETFSALKEQMKEEKEPEKAPTKSILDGIKIDLNAIEINTGCSELDVMRNEKAVLEAKRVMQVVCCQSSYSAEISSLKSQEIQNIADANVDFYNYKKRLYKALWNHIENTSVGKMDFATWMKVTSYFDIETLLYGAYCQTFPYENKYSLRCPKCENSFDAVVNNATLIETRGKEKEIYSKINEIVANVKDAKKLVENSQVHTTKRVAAEESKIIFDIYIPSVYDYLEGILSNVSEQFADEYSTTLGLALFIKKVYVPDVVAYERTGKLTFLPVENKGRIIELVSKLPYYDGLQLADEINEFTDKLKIDYSIKNVTCPQCGQEFPDIPMSMEDVLFTVIRQGRRGSNE